MQEEYKFIGTGEKPDLRTLLSFTQSILSSATGKHADDPFPQGLPRVSDIFNLDAPPLTVCRIYNKLFIDLFKTYCEQYNPDLLNTHSIIQYNSQYSLDLARYHLDPDFLGMPEHAPLANKEVFYKSTLAHLSLMLFSNSEEGVCVTPIDPYHSRPIKGFFMPEDIYKMDFSQERGLEFVRAFLFEFGTNSSQARSDKNFSREKFEKNIFQGINTYNKHEKIMYALFLCNIYFSAWENVKGFKYARNGVEEDLRKLEKELKEELKHEENYKPNVQHYKMSEETLKIIERKKGSLKQYNKVVEDNTHIEEVSELAVEQVLQDFLTSDFRSSPTDLIYLSTLIDFVGEMHIPLSKETYEEIIKYFDKVYRNPKLVNRIFNLTSRVFDKYRKQNRIFYGRVMHDSVIPCDYDTESSGEVVNLWCIYKYRYLEFLFENGIHDWINYIPKDIYLRPNQKESLKVLLSLLKRNPGIKAELEKVNL